MLRSKSYIFVYTEFRKGAFLFYLLTETITILAGDL